MEQGCGSSVLDITDVTQTPEIVRTFKEETSQRLRSKFSQLSKAGFLHQIVSQYEYDNHENLEWSIEIAHHQSRESFIENTMKVHRTNKNYMKEWYKMDKDLNKLYGEMRKHSVNDGVLAYTTIRPGLLVAVCDQTYDIIGRFRRGRVVEVRRNMENSKMTLPFITCELIDEAREEVFRGDQVYLLCTKFLQVPSRIFIIQLSGLKAFVGSPKLGRLFETVIRTYGYSYSMRIRKEVERDKLEVVLTSKSLAASSVNDYILSELFKADIGKESLLSPIQGTVFDSVIICYFKKEGQVGVRLKSREMDAIEDHLSEARENFSTYLLVHESEQERLEVGAVCLASHREKKLVFRCRIVSTSIEPATSSKSTSQSKSYRVKWMDEGGESDLLMTELIPARFVSQMLNDAEPQCIEFQLANISLLKKKQKVLALLPLGSQVSLRVVETGSNIRKTGGPITVELFTHLLTNYGEVFHSYNKELLQLNSDVESSSMPSQFSPKKFVKPSGMIHIPMNYPLKTWSSTSQEQFGIKSDHLTVEEGDKIVFFVSQIISSTDFSIHPWITRERAELLQCQMQSYCEIPWVRAEREEGLSHLPWGEFLIYLKQKVYYRAKFVNDIVNDNSTETRDFVNLLLLDKGRYERAEFKDVIRVNQPWQLFNTLSPQGAVGRWKYALDQRAELKSKRNTSSSKECEQKSVELEIKLRRKLETFVANYRQVTARVASVFIDDNGRADFHLVFKRDDEKTVRIESGPKK